MYQVISRGDFIRGFQGAVTLEVTKSVKDSNRENLFRESERKIQIIMNLIAAGMVSPLQWGEDKGLCRIGHAKLALLPANKVGFGLLSELADSPFA